MKRIMHTSILSRRVALDVPLDLTVHVEEANIIQRLQSRVMTQLDPVEQVTLSDLETPQELHWQPSSAMSWESILLIFILLGVPSVFIIWYFRGYICRLVKSCRKTDAEIGMEMENPPDPSASVPDPATPAPFCWITMPKKPNEQN